MTKLSGVRCAALEKVGHEMKQRLSELMEICPRIVMRQKPKLSPGFTAHIKQPYRGAGMLSDGEVAQGFRGIANRLVLLE